MRFRRLDARVFGPLQEREFDLAAPLVLVFGPNESGKSSFRAALDTVLFGFEPARRETHPLFLWNEERGDLHLEAEVELDNDERLAVERVLLSTGKSRVAEPGEPFEGAKDGNVALDGIEDTPRELFRSVYSLENEDLGSLDPKVQTHVDHLLLPAFGYEGLRPTNRVVAELRKEHKALWREDQRGKTEAQKLTKARVQALHELRRVSEEEEELRAAVEEQEVLQEKARLLRERRAVLERAEREAPFLKRLFELDYRRRAAPDRIDLSPLGGDALSDPGALSEEIRQFEEQLDAPRARLKRDALSLTPAEVMLVERGAEIEIAARDRAELDALESAHREHLERRERLREARDAELRSLGTPDGAALAELSIEVLRARREAWERTREEAAVQPRRSVDGLAIALFGLGLAAILFSVILFSGGGEQIVVAILGVVLLALAAARALHANAPRAHAAPPLDPDVAAMLDRAGIDPALRESPSALQRAIDALERLRRVEDEAANVRARIQADDERCAEITGRWTELGHTFGCEGRGGAEALVELERLRRAALERAEAVRQDESERRVAEQALSSVAPALTSRVERRERLERALRLNQPKTTDLSVAYQEVQRRLQEQTWLEQQELELKRDALWDELKDDPRGQAEFDPSEAPWEPEHAAQRRAELAELDEERSVVDRRLGEIGQMLADDPGARQARVQETARRLEAQLEEVHRRRDRLALLERVLERADQLFRDAHQPDVLRRAGEYLTFVTSGRYTRLDADADGRGGLQVFSEERGVAVPVGKPLSRGTRDQIHLCLRLGLLDHLDDEREKLPLVLDEVLIHSDTTRRLALYPLLERVAEKRQVFLLTCHEWLAEEAERALGIGRHSLAPNEAEHTAP